MGAVVIQFGQLESAARNMRYAASDMESYAEALPRKVQNPISSLTGGSSSNTSAVAQLAAQKARQLRTRATAYKALASKTEAFANEARNIDATVGRRIGAVADMREQGLSIWDRFKYNVYKAINGAIGATAIGAFLGGLVDFKDARKKQRARVIKDVLNWFKRGDGKYWLNIAKSIVGVVLAVAAAFAAFPAVGFLAIIVGVAAVVSAAVTFFQAIVTISDSAKALGKNNTEPGIARYYGSTGSLHDWAKKNTTDRGKQNMAGTVDFVGAMAGVVGSIAGLGVRTSADGITKVTSLDRATVKQNLLKEIGFKPGQYKGQYNDWKFSPGTIFGLGKGPTEGLSGVYRIGEAVSNTLSPVDRITKTLESILSGPKLSISTGIKIMGNIVPGVPGPKHVLNIVGFVTDTSSGKYWK